MSSEKQNKKFGPLARDRALLLPMDLRYVGHSCFMCPNPRHPLHFGPVGTLLP